MVLNSTHALSFEEMMPFYLEMLVKTEIYADEIHKQFFTFLTIFGYLGEKIDSNQLTGNISVSQSLWSKKIFFDRGISIYRIQLKCVVQIPLSIFYAAKGSLGQKKGFIYGLCPKILFVIPHNTSHITEGARSLGLSVAYSTKTFQ